MDISDISYISTLHTLIRFKYVFTGAKLTEATIDLYNKVSAKMLPTPAKIHYLFNLRDISKVFQGLLRSSKDLQDSKPRILRLWIHECYRVFYDRLIDDKYGNLDIDMYDVNVYNTS